jgi:hypothetical protein
MAIYARLDIKVIFENFTQNPVKNYFKKYKINPAE